MALCAYHVCWFITGEDGYIKQVSVRYAVGDYVLEGLAGKQESRFVPTSHITASMGKRDPTAKDSTTWLLTDKDFGKIAGQPHPDLEALAKHCEDHAKALTGLAAYTPVRNKDA